MKISTLKPIANAINAGELRHAQTLIRSALISEPGAHWHKYLTRIITLIDSTLANTLDAMPFTVIAKGNSKLGDKFLTWSTLPATEPGGIGCPGAGGCVKFCYSLKAWRYPAAFCRQAQNTILLQSTGGRAQIVKALDAFENSEYRIFRLYIDGDFSARPAVDGKDDFAFWMKCIIDRSIITYGYTKSFSTIVQHRGKLPNNYKLNISSGHNATPRTIDAVRRRTITRGEFNVVISAKVPVEGHGLPAHRQALVKAYRAKTGRKAFACPGACNTCTPRHGHACGSDKFNNVDIIIAAH